MHLPQTDTTVMTSVTATRSKIIQNISYSPPGLKLLLTSVAPKIRDDARVKVIVSRWSFLSGTKQEMIKKKITMQNNTYCSQIQVAFLDTNEICWVPNQNQIAVVLVLVVNLLITQQEELMK